MCADLCLGGQGGGRVVKIRRRLASLKLSVSDRSKPGLLLQMVCLANVATISHHPGFRRTDDEYFFDDAVAHSDGT